MQGAANIVASLLLRMLDVGNVAAVAAINDCILDTGSIGTATALASEHSWFLLQKCLYERYLLLRRAILSRWLTHAQR